MYACVCVFRPEEKGEGRREKHGHSLSVAVHTVSLNFEAGGMYSYHCALRDDYPPGVQVNLIPKVEALIEFAANECLGDGQWLGTRNGQAEAEPAGRNISAPSSG
jgi:hypothetical protein